MRLSKTSAYAALAMAYLANHTGNGVAQARQVAEYLSIPTDSALKVLQSLARRGLIVSHLGRNGGYRLERPANQITLLEIVEATDGPIDSDLPLHPGGHSHRGVDCLKAVCHRVMQNIRRELATTTVADLAGASEGTGLDRSPARTG